MSESLPYSKAARAPTRYASDIITITGATGVGTSTALNGLRGALGMPWRFVSGGSIMREFAVKNAMSIEEFAAHNREHPEEGWDRKCDDMLAAFGRQNFTVIEARLAHAFVPHAFHVLLVCDIATRARRRPADFESALSRILRRDDDDVYRYAKLYPGCLWSVDDFDLVIDTAREVPAAVCKSIIMSHAVWRADRMSELSVAVLHE